MEIKKTTPWLLAALIIVSCRPQQVVVAPAPSPVITPIASESARSAEQMLSAQGADAALWQNSSAEAHRIFQQGYELARIRLMENIQMPSPKPNAVIVDIDETVLDNSPYQIHLARTGSTYAQASWKIWSDKASAKAIPGALEFLKFAQQQKCEVFYITNRDIREKASTMKNLDSLGFPFVDDQHMMLMDGSSDKTERRAKVGATHRVVLLVGDQLRDYDERFKERSVNYGKEQVDAMNDSLRRYFILLPNATYGTYRDAVQGKGSDEEKFERMNLWFEKNGY